MGFSLLPRRAMARRGLIAALLRQSHDQGCPFPPFQLISRSYSNKLFVGGLSFRTDEDAVRRAFSQHGEVVEVKLISDRETGRPKGFGFITFESEADAETARSKMTGQLLDGRVIRVDKATSSRPPLPSSGFSSGSSGSVGGSFSSPLSSSLPPVAEDWGTIPSNIVDINAGASPTTAGPASTGFGVDTSKPFDSSSFGQAAASWPASTPAPPTASAQTGAPASLSNASTQTSTPSSAGSFNSNTFVSASSFSSNTFGSANTFSTSNFGSAANTSPSSSALNVSTSSNSFDTSTFGSATTTSISSVPSGRTEAAQPSTSCLNSGRLGSATLDAKPFESSTFGSAAGNTSTFESVSPHTISGAVANTTSVNASCTIVSSSSNTTSATSNTSTAISNVPLGTADADKPLESIAATGATSTASTMPASTHPLSSPALTSSGSFDFSNFSFNSSSYRDNDPPLPRRRPRPRPRPAAQTMSSDFNSSTASLLETRSPFGSNNQFAETSIPKPKGTEIDFGLLNITAPSPPGMRPQGVFDIDLPDDLPEIPPPEPKPKPKPMSLSMFPHRQLPALDLAYHTPEADNWSEIGTDPPKYDLSTLFPSMGELIKKDKEFHWDPYDFDPEFKLPPEEKVVIFDSDYDEPV